MSITRVQTLFSFLLLLFLPLSALADGRVIPPTALPVKITIPDQRALICYSNGTERLVIETRFTGPGTNFAWVVPLPGPPAIEEATTGLLPTLQYLFRPEIIHNVPRYYLGILLTIGLIYLFRLLAKYNSIGFAVFIFFLLLFLAGLLLPALATAKRGGMESISSPEGVSIIDRQLVGIFETTTIASPDAKALQAWLTENGYALPTNAEPVIATYVKEGWVFVAMKIRRDQPDDKTSTLHPLSFAFKTDQPVYPMRLTGVDNGPLSVELYVFGPARGEASHFKVESCTRPSFAHPLLHQWAADSAVATKLTATLSPADMRKDVWVHFSQLPFLEKKNRLFSRHGALTIALNWGTGLFAAGWLVACFSAFASETPRIKYLQRIGFITLTGIVLVGLVYLSLPKIEVKLVKGYRLRQWQMEQLALQFWLADGDWHTAADARAGLKDLITNPTNAAIYDLKSWDNDLVGGQFREEDSPGNYALRETNSQLQFIIYYPDGAEKVESAWDLPHKP